jgi:hypothetical protein
VSERGRHEEIRNWDFRIMRIMVYRPLGIILANSSFPC